VTYKNGDKYGGEWQDGKRHGNGTLWVLQEGRYKVRYSGDWQYDLPEVSRGMRGAVQSTGVLGADVMLPMQQLVVPARCFTPDRVSAGSRCLVAVWRDKQLCSLCHNCLSACLPACLPLHAAGVRHLF
jgi:hypothetical protein